MEVYRLSESNKFFEVVDNALLHLYSTMSETDRFTPIAKRNEVLVRYLKPILKVSEYRSVKNEIKRLISVGRDVKGNLEGKLVELNG